MTPSEPTSELPGRASGAGFVEQLSHANRDALRSSSLSTLMLNVTLRCDMTCTHCHHACSPSRTEEMSRETLNGALELARIVRPELVDVTGGEPSLWPHIRELIELADDAGLAVRVRTNLVSLARPENADLPGLFARRRVAVLASLPGTSPEQVADQRGSHAFEHALPVLRTLAESGYGSGDGLRLDLAYNPPLGRLPDAESALAARFRDALEPLGVRFDSLLAIANVPIGRYGDRLAAESRLGGYLDELAAAFNPAVAPAMACRHGIVVGWDGTLSDCDFNLAAGLGMAGEPRTLADALAACRAQVPGSPGAVAGLGAPDALSTRAIAFGPHCFACLAGAGSG